MVESFIENVHREDLNAKEKTKFCKRIMKIEKISSYEQLAKRISLSSSSIKSWFQAEKYSKEFGGALSPPIFKIRKSIGPIDVTGDCRASLKEFLTTERAIFQGQRKYRLEDL